MTAPLQSDVIVVGGGIIGCSSAFFLRRRGLRVTLLEADLVGRQASGTNFGNVRRQGRPLHQLPLAGRSRTVWRQLHELTGRDVEYLESGHLHACPADEPEHVVQMERYAAEAAHYGLPLTLFSERGLRSRFPFLGDHVHAGSYSPTCGHANPRLAGPALARAAMALGASICENMPVTNIERYGREFIVIAGSGQRFRAPVLLVAAGAWAAQFMSKLNEPVPMVARGPTMSVTEPLPYAVTPSVGLMTSAPGRSVYFRQVARGNIVIGGGPHHPVLLDRFRVHVDPSHCLIQWTEIQRLFPAIRRAAVLRSWSGIEGYMPDNLPVMGASGQSSGLYFAFGFSGEGFQLGPGVGDTMAELIAEGRTAIDLSPYSLGRFVAHPSRGNQAEMHLGAAAGTDRSANAPAATT